MSAKNNRSRDLKSIIKAVLSCEQCGHDQPFTLKRQNFSNTLVGECPEGHKIELDPIDPNKRKLLKAGAAIAVALVGGTSVLNLMFPDIRRWGIDKFIRESKRLTNSAMDFLNELGLDHGLVQMDIGPKDSRTSKFRYDSAASADALRTAVNAYYHKARVDVVDLDPYDTFTIRTDGHLILFGGASANPLTAIALGLEGTGNNLMPSEDYYRDVVPLRFYGISDVSDDRIQDPIFIYERGFGSNAIRKLNWGFMDRATGELHNCKKRDPHGGPVHDPLVITKMPNV